MSDRDSVRVAGQELLSRIAATMEKADWAGFLALADMLPRARRTFVTGAGRSGMVARTFGMRLMHCGLPVFIPGETITAPAGPGDLLVAISCTGTTGLTDYFAGRARQLRAKVVVLTANAESALAKHADRVVLVPADEENIVLRAAVFEHSTSLCLDAVFNVLSERLKVDQAEFQRRHANLE